MSEHCLFRDGETAPGFTPETFGSSQGDFSYCPAWKKAGDKTLKLSTGIFGRIYEALK